MVDGTVQGAEAGNGNGHQRNSIGQRPREVRYGVVGLGWFAQIAILPAFRHARRNSRLVALFSSDATKLAELGREHGVEGRYEYDELERAVREDGIDALYLAVPNHLHHDFALRAAAAGAHVLCEKPMAVSEAECEEMIAACRQADRKLMVAYRLHFEEASLCAIDKVASGRIGEARLFEAVFANPVTDPGNIRLDPTKKGGGPLWDIGIYCLNAARNVFRAEPEEVMAMSASAPDPRFEDCAEMSAAILRFPGERLATFSASFGAADHDRYTIHGTKGTLRVEPAFGHAATLRHRLSIGERSCQVDFPRRDQIAPEILHFSDCIQQDREPEPSGREGLADVRVICALHRSAAEGRSIRLEPFERDERPSLEQEEQRPPVGEQELVHAAAPSSG